MTPIPTASRVTDTGPFRIAQIDYPPHYRQGAHSHDGSSITLVMAGGLRESTRRGDAAASPLSVVMKPAGLRHANEFGPLGARTLQIAFRPEQVGDLALGDDLSRWSWAHGGRLAAAMLGLAHALRGPTEWMQERVLETFAALGREPPVRGGAPTWLARAREALDDELESGISVQRLADLVGAHPVSLSRAFRRCYGRSISEYRMLQRARHAATGLGASPHSISRVAHDSGYADHAHLTRDFRRLTGLTPTEFRRLLERD